MCIGIYPGILLDITRHAPSEDSAACKVTCQYNGVLKEEEGCYSMNIISFQGVIFFHSPCLPVSFPIES